MKKFIFLGLLISLLLMQLVKASDINSCTVNPQEVNLSISDQVTKTIPPNTTVFTSGYPYVGILRASNGGNNLFIEPETGGTAINLSNIRLYKISPIQTPDFTLNSDLIGGFVRIKNPDFYPSLDPGYVIEDGDPKYESYIDQVFQEHDAGSDDRLYYDLVTQNDKDTPYESYNIKKHKIDSRIVPSRPPGCIVKAVVNKSDPACLSSAPSIHTELFSLIKNKFIIGVILANYRVRR